MNVLDKWIENIKIFVWRNALQNTEPFSEINRIYKSLASFVPESQLIVSNSFRDNNPLTKILLNYDIVSIYQLLDIVLVIEYYQNHPDKESIRLKNNQGQINFNEFENRIFELYFNKILNDNSIKTSIDKSYFLKSGIEKPLDSFISYNGKEYLVECKNVKLERIKLIEWLVSKMFDSINRFKKDLHIAEVFKGFIGIKKQSFDSKDIHEIINSFDKQVKKYFSEYRNNKDSILRVEQNIENEIFKLYLAPAYFESKTEIETLKSSYLHYVSFNPDNFDYVNSRFKLNLSISINHNDLEEQLLNKIKKKIKQHKEADINDKLIVFGFESVIRNNNINGRIPDLERVLKGINFDFIGNKELSIVFLIKTFSNQKPNVKLSLAYNDDFDMTLKKTLLNLKYNWR